MNNQLTSRSLQILPVLLMVLGLVIANIIVSASLATSGSKLKALDQQKQLLAQQDEQLQHLLLKTTSLSSLEEKSTDLGFSKPDQIISITPTAPVALSTPNW